MDTESVQTPRRTKQVIVVRKDLDVRRGKLYSQVGHASMAFLTRRLEVFSGSPGDGQPYYEASVLLSPIEVEWLNNSYTKICVGVNSEYELLRIHRLALDEGIESHLVLDNGTTEFGGVKTHTCLALGPDDADRIDQLTGHLKLL